MGPRYYCTFAERVIDFEVQGCADATKPFRQDMS